MKKRIKIKKQNTKKLKILALNNINNSPELKLSFKGAKSDVLNVVLDASFLRFYTSKLPSCVFKQVLEGTKDNCIDQFNLFYIFKLSFPEAYINLKILPATLNILKYTDPKTYDFIQGKHKGLALIKEVSIGPSKLITLENSSFHIDLHNYPQERIESIRSASATKDALLHKLKSDETCSILSHIMCELVNKTVRKAGNRSTEAQFWSVGSASHESIKFYNQYTAITTLRHTPPVCVYQIPSTHLLWDEYTAIKHYLSNGPNGGHRDSFKYINEWAVRLLEKFNTATTIKLNKTGTNELSMRTKSDRNSLACTKTRAKRNSNPLSIKKKKIKERFVSDT